MWYVVYGVTFYVYEFSSVFFSPSLIAGVLHLCVAPFVSFQLNNSIIQSNSNNSFSFQ